MTAIAERIMEVAADRLAGSGPAGGRLTQR